MQLLPDVSILMVEKPGELPSSRISEIRLELEFNFLEITLNYQKEVFCCKPAFYGVMIFRDPHVSSAIYVDTKVCGTLLIIEITSLEREEELESMQIALPTALKFYDFDF